MTPLPEAIIRTAGETAEGSWPAWLPSPRSCDGLACGDARYVASPDGSLLAYVGTGDEGSPQIFTAGIDGTGVRQMTHDPTGAISPAWSPDGTMIAYATVAGTRGGFTGLFVLDVATGESRQVTDETGSTDGLQFTPDGSSLLYTGVNCPSMGCLRTVPIAGGPSTVLIGPGTDAWKFLSFAANGSMSPDGTLVTFFGGGNLNWSLGDPGPFVANADGTGLRALYSPGSGQPSVCFDAIPAGTWSPDGSRIACNEALPPTYKIIVVVDVATGDVWRVAKGRAATWLDDHTLLVER
jgi:Tol biopolymer transport system component